MKTAAVSAILLFAFILCATPALAQEGAGQGDVKRGELLGYTCMGCHGIDGQRNAYPSFRVPKLGGQKAAYLEAALLGYRSGERGHSTMHAQASSLSEQDIRDLAAYFATLGAATVEAGGAQTDGIPAAATCVACHGPNGIAVQPQWPTLAGQHEDYLVHALKQYRDGVRKNAVMAPFAQALSDTDIKLLAQYYASLDGLETTLKE